MAWFMQTMLLQIFLKAVFHKFLLGPFLNTLSHIFQVLSILTPMWTDAISLQWRTET